MLRHLWKKLRSLEEVWVWWNFGSGPVHLQHRADYARNVFKTENLGSTFLCNCFHTSKLLFRSSYLVHTMIITCYMHSFYIFSRLWGKFAEKCDFWLVGETKIHWFLRACPENSSELVPPTIEKHVFRWKRNRRVQKYKNYACSMLLS